MTDVHSIETRSYNMSRIRAKDTKPELLVRKFLFKNGLRYKLHYTSLPGKPDMVFPKYKIALFIHGCFWHGHEDCKYFVIPKTRTEWWTKKINQNIDRDNRQIMNLYTLGWTTLIVWECELKSKNIDNTLKNLLKNIQINA